MSTPQGDGLQDVDTTAKVVETHISCLLFLSDKVLKWRKPVRTPFLDLSSLEARRKDCEEEVRLNRRLAPDVYDGVATLSLGGEPVDYAVIMRRLPDGAQLANIVKDRPVEAWVEIDRVAEFLARFHRSSPTSGHQAEASRGPRVLAPLGSQSRSGPRPRVQPRDRCRQRRDQPSRPWLRLGSGAAVRGSRRGAKDRRRTWRSARRRHLLLGGRAAAARLPRVRR